MKNLLSDVSGHGVRDGLLSTISENWERMVDNIKDIIQRLMDNPDLLNQVKDFFENLV